MTLHTAGVIYEKANAIDRWIEDIECGDNLDGMWGDLMELSNTTTEIKIILDEGPESISSELIDRIMFCMRNSNRLYAKIKYDACKIAGKPKL